MLQILISGFFILALAGASAVFLYALWRDRRAILSALRGDNTPPRVSVTYRHPRRLR